MLQIAYLADHPEYVPTLARWFYDQWHDLHEGSTLQRYVDSVAARVNVGSLPTAFVARQDGRLVGSASLLLQDLESHPQLSPWLASVYVMPDARNQGIGSRLVRYATQEAERLGVDRLYLFTTDKEGFYERLGWRFIEQVPSPGGPVSIMAVDL